MFIEAFILGTIFFADIHYFLWYCMCCFAIAITGLIIIAPFTIKLINVRQKSHLNITKN